VITRTFEMLAYIEIFAIFQALTIQAKQQQL
jgi:hypothetical protein